MPRQLRKGKTKSIVESSRDAALLAVEVYNKPRTSFRTQAYVALMIIAWTRLFHAYFNRAIGDKYHYKKKRRYETIDGDRKSWELSTCIDKFNGISAGVEANLRLFIRLRNKIEHRHITRAEFDSILFGECQALLHNYERQLIDWFGQDQAMNESLAFSLQFSRMRTAEQKIAHKTVLSRELQDLRSFVDNYRTSLDDSVFSSPEYSVRIIVLPKVANTSRFDSAIEFVRYDDLDEAQREELTRVTAIIKEKNLVREAHNVGRLRPSEVVTRVQSTCSQPFTMPLHTAFWSVFSVRPTKERIAESEDAAFDTNAEYCLYDEAHNDYVYTESWVEFIVSVLDSGLVSGDAIRDAYRGSEHWKLEDFGGKE